MPHIRDNSFGVGCFGVGVFGVVRNNNGGAFFFAERSGFRVEFTADIVYYLRSVFKAERRDFGVESVNGDNHILFVSERFKNGSES